MASRITIEAQDMMNMIRSIALMAMLSLAALDSAAQTTHYGPAVVFTEGAAIGEYENAHVTVEFNSGTTFSQLSGGNPSAHFAVGGRGNSVGGANHPIGRGIAIGGFGQSHTGYCFGVMVEDFTDNTGSSAQIPDADDGNEMNDDDGLFGTCHSVALTNNTWYKVDLLISKLNVYWYLRQFNPALSIYVIVAEGGCYEDTGSFCPMDPFDYGFNDAFIANTVSSSYYWTSTTPIVSIF